MKHKKFIDSTQAQKFSLVHHNKDDKFTLQPIAPSQNLLKKGKWDTSQRPIISDSESNSENELYEKTGEAALYGIYFDDQNEYDYLQHLKTVGGGTLIENNSTPKPDINNIFPEQEQKKVTFDLPDSDSDSDLEILDPEVQEAIDALENESYADNVDDDFFSALNSEDIPDKYRDLAQPTHEQEHQEEWYKQFKSYMKHRSDSDDADSQGSLDMSQSNYTASKSVNGSMKRKIKREARLESLYSVSSSVLPRNKYLVSLDDGFEKLMDGEYASDTEESQDDDTDNSDVDSVTDYRLNAALDELDPSSTDGIQQIESLRKQLQDGLDLETERQRAYRILEQDDTQSDTDQSTSDQEKNAWDCQSILSTYSNIYNRPKILDVPKIQLKNGIPVEYTKKKHAELVKKSAGTVHDALDTISEKDENITDDSDNENDDTVQSTVLKGTPRPRSESPDSKKARKAQLKQEKKQRRELKKSVKEAYKAEKSRQTKTLRNKVIQAKTVSGI
jgi:protein LTV1